MIEITIIEIALITQSRRGRRPLRPAGQASRRPTFANNNSRPSSPLFSSPITDGMSSTNTVRIKRLPKDSGDREKVREAAREASEWLEANPEADKDDYAEKLKELEDVCSPAFAAAYRNAGGGHDGAAEEDDDHDEL